MHPSEKELLKAARQRVPGPSEGRKKTTTRGPPAPRPPTERPPAEKPKGERPREDPEEPPKSKHHKGSSSKKEKEKEREKPPASAAKGKAPASAAPPREPVIDVEAVEDFPALRSLFHGFTNNLDLTGSLGTTTAQVEENVLASISRLSCVVRHYLSVMPKYRQQEREANQLKASVAQLDEDKALLTAEKASLEEELGIRSRELRREQDLCEERRRRLEDQQKRCEDQRKQLEDQHKQLEDQRKLLQAVEASVTSEKEKAVADYLQSAEFKEERTVQTAAMLQNILDSTHRRISKRCPGLDTGFLFAESDEETEMTGAVPEAAPEAGPEAETAGGGVEEGEVSQPIELPPTPPTPHCDMP